MHPDDVEQFSTGYSDSVQSGDLFQGECRLANAAGEYRWFSVQSLPIRDASGTVLGWVGTCNDIDDQKKAVGPVQDGQKWLKAALDVLPIGVTIVEMGSAKITFVNRCLRAMAGENPLLPQNPAEHVELFALKDAEGNLIPASAYPSVRVANGERLDGLQMRWDSPTGCREMLYHSTLLPEMFGQPAAGILLSQDVTLFVRDQRGLQAGETALAKSNEDLQQFVYAASHDLQEPLRMISGYLQLLARRYTGKLDADADQYIDFAVDGANRMGQLIRDLLAFSRAGNPQTRRMERVAMTSVVQWATMNLETAIKEAEAVITHDALPDVTGDQARLALVLQNLIGNAIKYRSSLPPTVHVSARRDGGHWVFCLEDNGAGFEMKHSERIFGVFKRLHGKEIPGTGIGLAIAKKVVELHKGRMWAESEPGKGSRFYFTLPVEEQ